MSNKPIAHAATMEGKGAYNIHSRIPAAGGSLAIPQLAAAARHIPVEPGNRPIVITDYGSSEGKNSLAPMRAAIAVLRSRVGRDRAIMVYHTDLASNDFNSLFNVINHDPASYLEGEASIFPCAIGRSFYQSVLPPGHVDLGWSSYAAVWLSQVPLQIPDHFFINATSSAVREAFDRQAALDWARFLALRSNELRSGGRLVVALPSLAEDGSNAFMAVMDHANQAVAELVAAGTITQEERSRMTLASCPRRERDLMAPFAGGQRYEGLTVEYIATMSAPDVAWTDYENDHDAEALAAKRALFFRVIFIPSLVQALSPGRTPEECAAFADRLEEGLRRRLVAEPARMDHLVGVIALAKEGADA